MGGSRRIPRLQHQKEYSLGKELAENLELKLNDTLVMIGQGYHGATAADKFPVIGILDFPLQALNKQMVYMTIENARQFYSMPNRSTSKVIMVKNAKVVDKTIINIKPELSENLEIYSLERNAGRTGKFNCWKTIEW